MKVASSHVHRYKEVEIVVSSQDVQGTGDKHWLVEGPSGVMTPSSVAGEMSNVWHKKEERKQLLPEPGGKMPQGNECSLFWLQRWKWCVCVKEIFSTFFLGGGGGGGEGEGGGQVTR